MRAAVTEGVEAMGVVERPEPEEPGPGEVLVTPDAVGICGSDYHFYLGELSPEAGGSQFPRVQGHEIGATIAAVGPDCAEGLVVGQRVAEKLGGVAVGDPGGILCRQARDIARDDLLGVRPCRVGVWVVTLDEDALSPNGIQRAEG